MTRDYVGVGLRRIRERTNSFFAPIRRYQLTRTDFTVISNNCWAGSVYRYYGLPYQSPTAGLYFFASDYVKFVSDLRRYINTPLHFIQASDSRHADTLFRKGEDTKIIARLDDIEVVFLHYLTKQEAEEKWKRRCERINWDNVFLKFSEMNECTEEDILSFDSIPCGNKICFMSQPRAGIACGINFPYTVSAERQILCDTDRFRRGFNLTHWLNREPMSYPW
ncbi:Exopolysaccharide biosynthesis protein [Bifidobacterium italicum]|uniref:Exopolysaccharide biosynthesis protein n=1 Tax=Bifidobacterium italicum TaxID=1960968 RepID=A0A2A2EM71_9BIFI|nr:Exopolysaccharide biosynthesis protein [Bifidobacterium italicum]